MYSNKTLNFQESMTILNACTKKVWKLIESTTYGEDEPVSIWKKIMKPVLIYFEEHSLVKYGIVLRYYMTDIKGISTDLELFHA